MRIPDMEFDGVFGVGRYGMAQGTFVLKGSMQSLSTKVRFWRRDASFPTACTLPSPASIRCHPLHALPTEASHPLCVWMRTSGAAECALERQDGSLDIDDMNRKIVLSMDVKRLSTFTHVWVPIWWVNWHVFVRIACVFHNRAPGTHDEAKATLRKRGTVRTFSTCRHGGMDTRLRNREWGAGCFLRLMPREDALAYTPGLEDSLPRLGVDNIVVVFVSPFHGRL